MSHNSSFVSELLINTVNRRTLQRIIHTELSLAWFFEHFSPTPHLAYQHASNQQEYAEGVLAKITNLFEDRLTQMAGEFRTLDLPEIYDSNDVLIMEPSTNSRSIPNVRFATRCIGDVVLSALGVRDEVEAQSFMRPGSIHQILVALLGRFWSLGFMVF